MFTCGEITLHYRNKSEKKPENLVGDISMWQCTISLMMSSIPHIHTHANETKLKPFSFFLFLSLMWKVQLYRNGNERTLDFKVNFYNWNNVWHWNCYTLILLCPAILRSSHISLFSSLFTRTSLLASCLICDAHGLDVLQLNVCVCIWIH